MLREFTERGIKLEEIYLGSCHYDDSIMNPIGEFIQKSSTIKLVDIGDNEITNKGIEILASYIKGNNVLRRLSFYSNPGVDDTSIPLLLKIIEWSNLEFIDVGDTFIIQQNSLLIPLVENIMKKGLGSISFTKS